MDLELVYGRFPIFIQNIIVRMVGARITRRRYGSNYDEVYQSCLARERFSADDLHACQTRQLQSMFQNAAQSVYWRERFSEFGVNPNSPQPFEELKKLPVITKLDIRDRWRDIIPDTIDQRQLMSTHTSGTTGAGLIFRTTLTAEKQQWAVWWRYRARHGIDRNTWQANFGGRSVVPIKQSKPPFWRLNPPARQLLFSGYHLSEANAAVYVEALRNSPCTWLHGYPSLLSLLAAQIRDQNLPRPDNIKILTIGAESLLNHQRALIESVFDRPIFDHYGQAEAIANISQCEHGTYHVDEDFSYVEFIAKDLQPNAYTIVGTNWSNPAFPLFRYDAGDIATRTDTPCPCLRDWRTVDAIDGRQEDFVRLPSGAKLGRMDHIFKDLTNIDEAQIYQPDPARLVFRIVRAKGYSEKIDEPLLLQEARKRLGDEIAIEMEYVDQIEKTKTGKLRFVVSDVE